MRIAVSSAFRIVPLLAFAAVMAACAPAPIYATSAASVGATPAQVATAPGNFAHLQVIWGGKVIGVTNRQQRTGIRILAYPLDSSQRPRLDRPAEGRFTAVLPGFLDPMSLPAGTPVTVSGRLDGTVVGRVGQAAYTYPLVEVAAGRLHRWTPAEMRKGHPNVSFGVGVGGWIH